MNKSNLKFRDIDEYHALFPDDIQKILEQLRQTIKQATPQTIETISYGMPAFKQNKVLVYYAVQKEHIGFYRHQSRLLTSKKSWKNTTLQKEPFSFQ